MVYQILPNDEKEQDRLDLLHHVFRLCLDGGLCRTKLESPQKILDVGTGTGIWAIESGHRSFAVLIRGSLDLTPDTVADEFPSAEVIGVDLSPIQPGWSVLPLCVGKEPDSNGI